MHYTLCIIHYALYIVCIMHCILSIIHDTLCIIQLSIIHFKRIIHIHGLILIYLKYHLGRLGVRQGDPQVGAVDLLLYDDHGLSILGG